MRYAPDLIDGSAEAELVRHLERLPLREFQFHGFTGRRRVASFGWQYDFTSGKVRPADEIPPFLLKLGARAAEFGRLDAADLRQVLVTEYSPGAAIGWHRDKREFGTVIGVSLANACRFRLRRRSGSGWERTHVTLEPRSAYVLSGPARTEWEHSIPPVEALRYSVTFRTLANDREA
jgi:alkylated DNA repair dioxygenase AlkB